MTILNRLWTALTIMLMSFCFTAYAADETIDTETTEKHRIVAAGDTLTIDGARFTGNIWVRGGRLDLKNSAVVNGAIKVTGGGFLFSHTGSTVTGAVKTNGADVINISHSMISDFISVDTRLVVLNNSTATGQVKISAVARSNSSASILESDVSLFIIEEVIVAGIIQDNLNISESNVVQLVSSRAVGNLVASGNSLFITGTNEVDASITTNGNGISYVSDNVVGGSLRVANNVETYVIKNNIVNKLIIIPGGGNM